MIKAKERKTTFYLCRDCGSKFPKWSGRCPNCASWNSLTELVVDDYSGYALTGQLNAGSSSAPASPSGNLDLVDPTLPLNSPDLPFCGSPGGNRLVKLNEIDEQATERFNTSSVELDRVLGGGLVAGSTILLGGDPGIGKSTLLLQILGRLSARQRVVYVSGEESLRQIAARARRLKLPDNQLLLLTETCLEKIFLQLARQRPTVVVIDSIQTVFTQTLAATPGSGSQLRECAARLVRYAKQQQVAIFIVGHVTKEGALAGPRILEHMVDSVLYFEGDSAGRYRIIRAVKNRFGAVDELGIFVMSESGLKEVRNPSAIFLANYETASNGSSVMVLWEGSRALLVEIQALVDDSYLNNPRRVAVGFDTNRLILLLAVLNRHGQIASFNKDVFVNVVGGLRVNETAADLPLLLAIISSINAHTLPRQLIAFGEVGLSGEIRPVPNGQERLRVAIKQGFTHVMLPAANLPKEPLAESSGTAVHLIAVKNLTQALQQLHKLITENNR